MKKFLSILLSVTMLMTILPATFAFAEISGGAMVLEAMVLEDGLEATEIKAGDTITVNINYASGFAYTDSLTLVLNYDANYLTLVSGSAEKLPSGNINSETAGEIIYSCFSDGDPVKLEANEMIVEAQFTVNPSITAQDFKTILEIEVTECTCTDIIDSNTGNALYPGGNGSLETLDVPCSVDNKTITINPKPKSSDATLKSLKYGNTEIELINGEYDYTVELPYGSTIPVVTCEVNHAKATATASTADGVTTIVVTAENGIQLTYTLTITVAEKLYTLNVMALSGTIKATYLDKEDVYWGSSKTEDFPTGTEITLKATEDEGAIFLYWKDNESGRIISYNTEYTVTIGTNKKIVAVFVEKGSYMVDFIGTNNKIYASSQANLDITVPEDPYVLGYTFMGWAIDGSKVAEYVAGHVIEANTFKENTTIKALQEVDETTYTVTVTGADSAGGSYKYNDLVVLNPAEAAEGKCFAYWMRDGQIVSYDKEYRFYVGNYNTTVEAVFVGAGEEVEAKPVISMAAPTIVAGNKISFMMERNVPEDFSVVEAGILIKKGYIADGDENQITLDSHDYKGTSANTARYGSYAIRKANVKPYEWWSAVGYLIYKDKDGKNNTIYSSHVRGWIDSIGDGGLEDGGDL